MAFTPLVSPAVTPPGMQFHDYPQYAVSGAYFSPLTSPALHAQRDGLAMLDQASPHQQESSSAQFPPIETTPASLYRLTRENSEGGRDGIEQADSSKDSYQQSVNLFEKYPSIYKRPNTANKPNTPPRPTLDPPQQSARLRDYLDRKGVPMFGAGNTSLKSTRVGPSLPGLRPTVDLGIFNHRPSHTAKLSYPAVHHDALTYCRTAVAVFSAQARRRLTAPG